MRWLSAIVLIAAAASFIAVGEEGGFIIPGILLGIAGLWGWDKGIRNELQPPKPVDPVGQRVRPLEEKLLSLQDELAMTQRQLKQLGEEREFLRRLYPSPDTVVDRFKS